MTLRHALGIGAGRHAGHVQEPAIHEILRILLQSLFEELDRGQDSRGVTVHPSTPDREQAGIGVVVVATVLHLAPT